MESLIKALKTSDDCSWAILYNEIVDVSDIAAEGQAEGHSPGDNEVVDVSKINARGHSPA